MYRLVVLRRLIKKNVSMLNVVEMEWPLNEIQRKRAKCSNWKGEGKSSIMRASCVAAKRGVTTNFFVTTKGRSTLKSNPACVSTALF